MNNTRILTSREDVISIILESMYKKIEEGILSKLMNTIYLKLAR